MLRPSEAMVFYPVENTCTFYMRVMGRKRVGIVALCRGWDRVEGNESFFFFSNLNLKFVEAILCCGRSGRGH